MKKIKTVINTIITSSPKVGGTDFSKWKEKMETKGGNFRERADRAGVPPEMVKDFKYWLRENKL